ncbi:hypothetical protein HYALB_00008211 [Hymenoscyphus albidus]|uniref:Uncharacterized protein n=1 Tax=Hymenoscyphus albidus TaxID=595503 RepID=A0A9N9LWL3_9HELO|nr:hypothetical protein HYALB_00008211 [Hymenoscyphus albidus]
MSAKPTLRVLYLGEAPFPERLAQVESILKDCIESEIAVQNTDNIESLLKSLNYIIQSAEAGDSTKSSEGEEVVEHSVAEGQVTESTSGPKKHRTPGSQMKDEPACDWRREDCKILAQQRAHGVHSFKDLVVLLNRELRPLVERPLASLADRMLDVANALSGQEVMRRDPLTRMVVLSFVAKAVGASGVDNLTKLVKEGRETRIGNMFKADKEAHSREEILKLPLVAREFAYSYIKEIRPENKMGWKFVEKCTNKAQLIRQWEALAKTPENNWVFLEWRKDKGGRLPKYVNIVAVIKQAIILSQHPHLAVNSVEYKQHQRTMSKVINEARPYFDLEEALGRGVWLFTPPFKQATISSRGQGIINQLAELVRRLLPDVVEYFDYADRNVYIQRNDIQRLDMDLSGPDLRELPRMYLWEPEAVMKATMGTEPNVSPGTPRFKRRKIQAS